MADELGTAGATVEAKVIPAETSTPTEDWQKKSEGLEEALGKTNADLAKVTQQFQSWQGTARKQGELEALILRQGQLTEALVEHMASPDADPDALKSKVAGIKAKDAEALYVTRDKAIAQGYLADIGELMETAKIPGEDPRMAGALKLWSEGGGVENPKDLQKLFQATLEVRRVTNEAKDEAHKQALATEKENGERLRQEVNVATGNIAVGTQVGLPTGSAILADLLKVDLTKKTNKEVAEHEKALNAALGIRGR